MLILSLSYFITNVLFIDRFILKITQGKNLHIFKVNLADQRASAEKFKNIVAKLRVKDTAQSRKQKTLRFHKSLQVWQHGIIVTTNANSMLFDALKAKYDIIYVRTSKLNQAN